MENSKQEHNQGLLIIFLLVFLSIYSGIHLYCFLKIKRALICSSRATDILAIFMALMVFAPVIVRILEKHGFEFVARSLAYLGYTWMGLLFLFVSSILVLDIFRLLPYICGLILQSDFSGMSPSPRVSFIISLTLSVVIAGYGAFEAKRIRVEHVTIETHKIPKEIGRLKIVQISDVHLGLMVREKRLKRILNQVKSVNPDILVSTGDLLDGQTDNLSHLAEMLSEVSTTYGKFAVTGNHEFYAGITRALDFIKNAGFTILQGEGLTISGLLNIAGVDDTAGSRYGLDTKVSEKALLAELPREKFTLLLKHRPRVDKDALGFFDLQLSGHIHKGQIFPFNLITMLFYPVTSGLHKIDTNAWLYVSRGSGTWGPPIRFVSPPEVTLIELAYGGTGD
ncbi:MAG: metallophosphoesterase [Deltaproteobacteria bacterium]|nr:metallophosphoesterase [Deltaproteobacteria bacterium]MBW1825605.1 metallophosphoesterase [Deltaproteobacteria bacterium]MBW1970300.1 metallophosphoesterase [Deltaproteobacteria bacterium]MBW2198337.1 metallophosphoesterase [Deltaproteobacteria bacterium]MBW2228031.1 metallophosphoesterase [Deltaproteobacteria bacterium]